MKYDESEKKWILRRKVPVSSYYPYLIMGNADTVMAMFLAICAFLFRCIDLLACWNSF